MADHQSFLDNLTNLRLVMYAPTQRRQAEISISKVRSLAEQLEKE
jgi:hypothetical protein